MARSVRIKAGFGMDGRYESESPWTFLANMKPKNGRLVPIPGWYRDPSYKGQNPYMTGSTRWKSIIPMDSSKLQIGSAHYGVTINESSVMSTMGEPMVVVHCTNPEGRQAVHTAFFPHEWRDYGLLKNGAMAAALGNRVFFTGGENTYCVERDWPVPDGSGALVSAFFSGATPIYDNERGVRLWAVNNRPGIDAANQPYVQGNFGAPIIEAHLGRLFFTGKDYGEVEFDKAMSDNEMLIYGDQVLESTKIRVNSQTIVWTDPDDPFAIALGNFLQLQSRSKIKALCSHQDVLFIFCEDEIWTLTGTDETTFAVKRISHGIGIDGPRACVSTDFGVAWSTQGRYYMTDGASVLEIGDQVDHLRRGDCNSPLLVTHPKTRAVYCSKARTIYWSCVGTIQSFDDPLREPNVVAFDLQEKAWYTISAPRNGGYKWGEVPYIFEHRGGLCGIGNMGLAGAASPFNSWFTLMETFQMVTNATVGVDVVPADWVDNLYITYYAPLRQAISREFNPEMFKLDRVGEVCVLYHETSDSAPGYSYPATNVAIHSGGKATELSAYANYAAVEPDCMIPRYPEDEGEKTWGDLYSAGDEARQERVSGMAFNNATWIDIYHPGFPYYETWAYTQNEGEFSVGVTRATIAALEFVITDSIKKVVK